LTGFVPRWQVKSHGEKGPGKDPDGINHPNEYQHVHFEETRERRRRERYLFVERQRNKSQLSESKS
jgi:hypothetical protein